MTSTHNVLDGFEIARNVTLPLFKLEKNKDYFFQITGQLHIGKELKGQEGKAASERKQPATICNVIDLTTGEEGQIIAPVVLQSELNEQYPDHSYVGRFFRITLTRPEGKAYNLVTVAELKKSGESADQGAKAKAKAK